MGSLGGGLGTYIAHLRNLPEGPETYSSTLTGMAAAMGPLLPSPILSVLLLHELCVMAGKAPEHFMEQVVSFGIASTTSWFIYTYFMEDTLLESTGLPFAINDLISCDNLSVCHDYKVRGAASPLTDDLCFTLTHDRRICHIFFRRMNGSQSLYFLVSLAACLVSAVSSLWVSFAPSTNVWSYVWERRRRRSSCPWSVGC